MKESSYSKQEYYLKEFLTIQWKNIFTINDAIDVLWNKASATFSLRNLRSKWLITKFNKNKYMFVDWNNSLFNNFIAIQNILKKPYYFWWMTLINDYWITEQMWAWDVVYNSEISWIKKVNWQKVEFIKTNYIFWIVMRKIPNTNLSYPIASLERIIIDCINNPWFLWWTYEKLIKYFKRNLQKINIKKVILYFKKMWNKSWLLRFLYLCEVSWLYTISDNELKKYLTTTYIYLNPLKIDKKKENYYINSKYRLLIYKY